MSRLNSLQLLQVVLLPLTVTLIFTRPHLAPTPAFFLGLVVAEISRLKGDRYERYE